MPKLDSELPRVSDRRLTTTLKKCPKCKRELSVDCFCKDNARKDNLNVYCKECSKETYQENRESILKQRKIYVLNTKEQRKIYLNKNIVHLRKKQKEYREKNKDILNEKYKKWLSENKEKYIECKERYRSKNIVEIRRKQVVYNKKRKENSLEFRIKLTLLNRIRSAVISSGGTKAYKSAELLGCTIPEYRKYIESLFTDGMSWKNCGRHGWHFDHIKPCALFDLTDPSQQKECFNYKNTQPLWAIDNLKKGASYDKPTSSNRKESGRFP